MSIYICIYMYIYVYICIYIYMCIYNLCYAFELRGRPRNPSGSFWSWNAIFTNFRKKYRHMLETFLSPSNLINSCRNIKKQSPDSSIEPVLFQSSPKTAKN